MKKLVLAMSMVAAVTGVSAQVLTFEGLSTGPLTNYAGYQWLGVQVTKPLVSVNKPRLITGVTFEYDEDRERDVAVYTTEQVDAGFHRSMVSGDTVAHTTSFSGSTSLFSSISAVPNAANFDFFSAYLTSGYREDITVSVIGKRDGAQVYSQALTVGDDAPVNYTFNFLNIDSIEFLSSGGTFLYANGTTVGSYANPSMAFSTPVLVFDNINMAVTAVPEPETWAMLLGGLGLMGMHARRRKAKGSTA